VQWSTRAPARFAVSFAVLEIWGQRANSLRSNKHVA
jgi:hypothetical protein